MEAISVLDNLKMFFVFSGSFLLSPLNLVLMFGSMVIGILFGVLPGLSATVAIALFASITYGMALDVALTILFGVYIGAIFGGSISAILINIPGTGSAAATCLDGHPLALKGETRNANLLARSSSVIGTLFGLAIFVLFTPMVTKLALMFTSPEFFWLSIFGILICGSISNADVKVKGWIAGFIGLLLALVGLDDIQGWTRLTFGIPDLMSGIPFVPMTIAFFGLPQIVKVMKSSGSREVHSVKEEAPKVHLWPILKRNIFNIFKWGGIGVGIGAVPGVGENIAAWVAYDDAKRHHPDSKKFGTGVYEGVMAPETANNAAIGGAVIPLISLGIPGSPPAAMLLGALSMHGLKVGPLLSIERPEIIPMIGSIILWGTIFLFICGLLVTRPMVAVLKISPKILMPIITVLCVIGTFAYNNNPFHLTLVFVCAIAGYLFDKMQYSSGALILGLILGNMADSYFRRALFISDGNFLTLINRPIALIFFIACVWTIAKQFGFSPVAMVKSFGKKKHS
ncbi:MAG: tripartite tricarboxylate transporter permease [Sphaerochaeta sp.]|nr:tripartite tricarboxylate transporter permease [Sphaerochaeta sp.]